MAPQIHLTGVIVHGLAELYFGADSNMKKDSNSQRSILARSFDIVESLLLARHLSFPPHVVLKV